MVILLTIKLYAFPYGVKSTYISQENSKKINTINLILTSKLAVLVFLSDKY